MSKKIVLPKLDVCGKPLRFVWFNAPQNIYLDDVVEHGQMLFLASDVLAYSNVSSKNQCRIHARYSKEGLASKIVFTEQIPGLTNKALWFYNIKGLFKVAFEYLDESFQEYCLTTLQSVWLADMNHPSLPADICAVTDEFCEAPNVDQIQPQNATAHNAGTFSPHKRIKLSDPQTAAQTDVMTDIGIFVEKMLKRLQDSQNNSDNTYDVEALIALLEFFTEEYIVSTDQIFPMDIIKKYTSFSKVPKEQRQQTIFDISQKQEALMCLFGTWLGQEFSKLSPKINSNLLQFKQSHLDCIDNLPPAAEIIQSIFPQCMSRLVYSWLLGDKSNSYTADHIYSSQNSLTQDQCPDISPLVQIILEFANNALISGVAHVVYTKIKHSNSS